MTTLKEIVWLAGLLEGEGSFSLINNVTPAIRLGMTDKDVVEHAAKILGTELNRPTPGRLVQHKTMYDCAIFSFKAIGWMMTLYSFLGNRRREKISNIIYEWKNYNYSAKGKNGKKVNLEHLLSALGLTQC